MLGIEMFRRHCTGELFAKSHRQCHTASAVTAKMQRDFAKCIR